MTELDFAFALSVLNSVVLFGVIVFTPGLRYQVRQFLKSKQRLQAELDANDRRRVEYLRKFQWACRGTGSTTELQDVMTDYVLGDGPKK